MSKLGATMFFVYVGRVVFTLEILALLGAWPIQLVGWNFFDFGQTQFLNVAIVLSLPGIGMFLDAFSICSVFEKRSVIIDPRWLGIHP